MNNTNLSFLNTQFVDNMVMAAQCRRVDVEADEYSFSVMTVGPDDTGRSRIVAMMEVIGNDTGGLASPVFIPNLIYAHEFSSTFKDQGKPNPANDIVKLVTTKGIQTSTQLFGFNKNK